MAKKSKDVMEKTAPGRLAAGKSKFREYAEAFIIAVILALFIRTFIVQAFKIPSGSMENTLLIGDHLLVNKFIYGTEIPFTDHRILVLRHPKRGDVIVFLFPGDDNKPYMERRDFIKRVIGVPGDTVSIRDKEVFVNGKPIHIPEAVHNDVGHVMGDQALCADTNTFPRPEFCRDYMPPIKVPPHHYFVMGDNRDFSYDSRFWGFVPERNIQGLAFIKYWSWDAKHDRVRWRSIGSLIH